MYDRNKIYEQAKEVTVKNKLFFIEDIVAFLPISKKTFYEYFPIESDESNELKELLQINKTELKVGLRKKWYGSDNATLQMALMKLICSDEERKMLSMNHTDLTTNGKEITGRYSDWTDEQIKSELERLRNL
jgi:hypothetical protein